MKKIFSVGHSNRDHSELFSLLTEGSIDTLVDIRVHPHSRRHPQWDSNAIRAACGRASIEYHWAGRQLGGLRQALADSPHTALVSGLRGFADHMRTPHFARSLTRLIRLAETNRVAIMCAEKQPELCHRSLIADALLLQDVQVIHLINQSETRTHRLRAEARLLPDGLVYDRHRQQELDV